MWEGWLQLGALATNFASFFSMLPFDARTLETFTMYLQPSLGSHGRNDYNPIKRYKSKRLTKKSGNNQGRRI